ncbi:hypothetical protein A2U01_0044938, partial [Trifolium medium]|nr:hypothetical protein [Trifolium medium]
VLQPVCLTDVSLASKFDDDGQNIGEDDDVSGGGDIFEVFDV